MSFYDCTGCGGGGVTWVYSGKNMGKPNPFIHSSSVPLFIQQQWFWTLILIWKTKNKSLVQALKNFHYSSVVRAYFASISCLLMIVYFQHCCHPVEFFILLKAAPPLAECHSVWTVCVCVCEGWWVCCPPLSTVLMSLSAFVVLSSLALDVHWFHLRLQLRAK